MSLASSKNLNNNIGDFLNIERKDELLIFEISNQEAGKTIREFLDSYALAKKKVHELYMRKKLLVNGVAQNSTYILKERDKFAIPVFEPEAIDFIPEKIKFDIIYEDDHLLIINKPAGIQVHPDQKKGTGTLVNGVAYYFQQQGLSHRVRYIHRLDIGTSGVMIFAKHYLAHSLLDRQLANKEIKRWYLALVSGVVKNSKGKIEAPIGKDRHHSSRRRVAKNGDYALTYYQVKKQFSNYALVELRLQTGRTHQIRVHMTYLGHPLLGDTLYGTKPNVQGLKRQALHSSKIEFIHPMTKEFLAFEIPFPWDLKKYIKN